MNRRGVLRTALVLLAATCACRVQPPGSGGRNGVAQGRRTLRVAVPRWFRFEGMSASRRNLQAELLLRLQERLGLPLEFVPVAGDPAEAVRRGRADLAVSRFAPWELAERGLAATEPVEWVNDVLVESPRAALPGRRAEVGVWLYRGDPYWRSSPAVLGKRARYPLPEELPPRRLLNRLISGRYGATIVDTGMLAALGLTGRVRVRRTVAHERPVVWVVSSHADSLRRMLNEFLFAEHVRRGSAGPAACRDLDGVTAARTLRLLTRDGPATCTVQAGGLTGFQYELVRRFALELGVRLELVLLPQGADPVSALEEGRGDLLALHEPLPLEAEGRAWRSPPLRLVEGVAVVRRGSDRPTGPWDLAGRRVATPAGWGSILTAMPIVPPPEVMVVADGLSALAVLGRGAADVAVVSADLARLVLGEQPELVAGAEVVPPQPLGWILRPDQKRLQRRVTAFVARVRRTGVLRAVTASLARRRRRRKGPAAPRFALSPWDVEFKRAAKEVGIDWRLLAAVSYEESRWDPNAVGPGGSAGLFQLMPVTASWLGIRNPFDPAEAVPAAAGYLAQLMEEFSDAPLGDRVAMAVAAFNVGPRHVHDARTLARRMGLDPNRWRNSVETAMVLLDDPEVARKFPAGVCRCRRAVHYTRRILRRYFMYVELFPAGGSALEAELARLRSGPPG